MAWSHTRFDLLLVLAHFDYLAGAVPELPWWTHQTLVPDPFGGPGSPDECSKMARTRS